MHNNLDEIEYDETSIKVLMYQRIVDNESLRSIHWSYVSVGQLRKHLELLGKWGITPITFVDYQRSLSGEFCLPKRPVILTFENGYRAARRLAFPLIKEYGMNAVIFALGDRAMETDQWDRQMGLQAEQLASDEELIEMHEAGFEVGSHSLSHMDLTRLMDQEATTEISGSKEALESVIRDNVLSFSYPYGAVDGRIREMVMNAGYRFGCGIDTGSPHFGADPLNIRRITITSSTGTLSFGLKLLTSNEKSEWIGAGSHQTFQNFRNDDALAIRNATEKEGQVRSAS